MGSATPRPHVELMKFAEFEEVGFTYDSISWTWNDGSITTTDNAK